MEGKLQHSEKTLGFDKETWYERFEKKPPTEEEKQHASMKEAGLGELWAGPQPPPPAAAEPDVHMAGRRWEKLVAKHYGLIGRGGSEGHGNVREEVAQFADTTHVADPNDACKYLAIEEFRCLKMSHPEKDPEHAAMKCLKWFEEWKQCQWDQHKFNEGISYIDGPELRKAYRFAPNYKYA